MIAAVAIALCVGHLTGIAVCRHALGLPILRRRRPDITPATRGSYLQMAGRAQRGRK